MRIVAGFLSMLALGIVLAAALVVLMPAGPTPGGSSAADPLDYMSVVAGLALGLVVALLWRVSWAELPQRAADGVLGAVRRWSLVGVAVALAAVLVYL